MFILLPLKIVLGRDVPSAHETWRDVDLVSERNSAHAYGYGK